MPHLRPLLLAAALSLAGLTSAQAQTVLYTTLPAEVPSTGSYNCVGNTTVVSAVELLTPAGVPFQLTAATVYMYVLVAGNPSLTLNVHTDNNGVPGTVVGSMGTQATGVQNTFASYTFTPSAPVALSAATHYWIVASSPAADTCAIGWHFPGENPSGVLTYVNERQFTDSWQERLNNHPSLELRGSDASQPPATVQPVPTLSGWALLLLLSMVGGLGLRKLRTM